MALDSYTGLVAEVQDWLFGRADIAAKAPTFIRMFEAKANRTLKCRQMENRATTSVNIDSDEPEFVTLPADFSAMRRLRLIGTTNKPRLAFLTTAQMDDKRATLGDITGTPDYFSITADELELFPTPTSALELEMTYRRFLTALSGSNASNWLLELAPDAYLYGALMEAAPYLHEDERIPVWAEGVKGALQQVNDLSQEALYNAGPLTVRKRGYG